MKNLKKKICAPLSLMSKKSRQTRKRVPQFIGTNVKKSMQYIWFLHSEFLYSDEGIVCLVLHGWGRIGGWEKLLIKVRRSSVQVTDYNASFWLNLWWEAKQFLYSICGSNIPYKVPQPLIQLGAAALRRKVHKMSKICTTHNIDVYIYSLNY